MTNPAPATAETATTETSTEPSAAYPESAKPKPEKSQSTPSKSTEPQGEENEHGTDWKSEARKHETRAKANKAAADKAAADKADADAARQQAESRSQETLDAIAKALGFKKDDAPPDPEALQRVIAEKDGRITDVERDRDQQVQSLTDRLRESERLVAVMYHAADPTLGVNLRALWDSKQFEKSVAALDHESDSFEKDALAVIKKATESNPAYRINQTASAAQAGIGASGSNQSATASASPGVGRLSAYYDTTGKT